MRYTEILDLVRDEAGLSDRQSADAVLKATLRTLAERMPDATAEHFAAQLPDEAAEEMDRSTHHTADTEERERGEKFDLTTFAGRVAWRSRTDEETALRHAAAVFEVLDDAVAPELMVKLRDVLPADVVELLPIARAEPPGEGT
ncbi:DUF2267 domain-containing protein [Streptomyces iconiensis]|uniref:DUF2267 domain-containing protein n=1 Tax=Streptomyces iconiensis TaxID=1384038 RepID=A0ABT6ZVZ6_9ACTN|nr:DUF2267 domain-containing protein [Streptomyces iconiensis]MDJ1132969.1 DUF2267 domain-containing protein [Streptomyces iconiensis]